MKWKNIDIGPAYYYITGTITQWLPLLSRPDIRQVVYDDISTALQECGGSISAFVMIAGPFAHADISSRKQSAISSTGCGEVAPAGTSLHYLRNNVI